MYNISEPRTEQRAAKKNLRFYLFTRINSSFNVLPFYVLKPISMKSMKDIIYNSVFLVCYAIYLALANDVPCTWTSVLKT